jgi:FkbM family methyltransferase
MLQRWIERVVLAARRPDLAWRRLRGLDVIAIELDEIAPYISECPVIVEAGALNGSDTVRFAERWPDAEIHAFEPVPSSYALVEENTRHLRQVHRYPLALADTTEVRTMFISSDPSGSHGSSSLLRASGHLVEYPDVAFEEQIDVDAVTLRDWAATAGVGRIDLLWLDLQGMELPVLKASPGVLTRTRAVCMEVSRRELYRASPLYPEVVTWMKSQNFDVIIDRVLVGFGNVLFVRQLSDQLFPE